MTTKLPQDLMDAALAGDKLSLQQVQTLEKDLYRQPHNLPARAALLTYYFRRGFSSRQDRINRRKHVLWMIKNEPSANLTGQSFATRYRCQASKIQRL